MRNSGQAGFSLLAMLIAVMIVGVMASMAVPRFASTMAAAHTAKIQSDLSTLDAAIAVYQLERGEVPTNVSQLANYVNDIDHLKPPNGKCNLTDGSDLELKDAVYELKLVTEKGASAATMRAVCKDHTAGDFGHGEKKQE